MRIGIYVGRHAGEGGGIAVYARSLLAALPNFLELHPEVSVIVYGHNSLPSAPVILHPRIRYSQTWSKGGHRIGILADQLILPMRIKADRLDLLHSLANLGVLASAPCQIVTVHDLFQAWTSYPVSDRTSIIQLFYRLLFSLQFRKARTAQFSPNLGFRSQASPLLPSRGFAFITDGPQTAADISSRFTISADKIKQIPLGVDDVFLNFHHSIETNFVKIESWCNNRQLDAGYILLYGSLDPRKNSEGAIYSYLLYRERLPHPRPLLVKVPNDETRRFLEQRDHVRKGVKLGWIQFVSWVERDELPLLVFAAGALLVPSYAEGFGFPALEAAVLGCPVITGPNDSLEPGSPGVFHCNPALPSSIAEEISAALNSNEAKGAALLANRLEYLRKAERPLRTLAQAMDETLAYYLKVTVV